MYSIKIKFKQERKSVMKQKKKTNKPKSNKPTMCPHAKSTDQYHGWECTIAGGECAYLVPIVTKCPYLE